MPSGAINYKSYSETNCTDDGNTVFTKALTSAESSIVNGVNSIAIEVHQYSANSTDIALDVQVQGTVVETPFTLFPYGSSWKYLADGKDQGTNWRTTVYDDSQWPKGPAILGFNTTNNPPIATRISYGPDTNNRYITSYFRKDLNISNLSIIDTLIFNARYDDGLVVYINGFEVHRNKMPVSDVSYATLANRGDDGKIVHTVKLTKALSRLVSGNNVIAVEVHQFIANSNDLIFDMQFQGKVKSNTVTGQVFSKTNLTRGPYLQKATPSSIVLRWRTSKKVNTIVKYGTDVTNLSQTVTVPGDTTEHLATLTGLSPYTKYYYSIGFKDTTLQGDNQNYFLTSPLPGTAGKYTFWVVGDCGNNSTNQKNVRDQFYLYRGNKETNGWLLLGDNAYYSGTDNQYRDGFFSIYDGNASKNIPLWPAPGNHDYDNSSSRQLDHSVPYYSIFEMPTKGEAGGIPSGTEAYYSYDYGNIHFLSLDSYGKEDQSTRLYDTTGAQVTWIKKDLAANKGKWTIAYWHHPPYTMGSHNSDTENDLTKIRTNFIRILERNGVDLILCGHSHDYERSKLMKGHYGTEPTFNANIHNLSQSSGRYNGSPNSCTYLKDSLHTLDGTVYVLSGSAGQLGGQQSSFPHEAMRGYSDATNGGSLVLEIEGSRLDAKWINADGQIRDNFTIIKDASKVKTLNVALGDSVNLTASWKGNYKWSTGTSLTSRTVNVKPTQRMNVIATDVYECVADTFKINVITPTVIPSTANNFCVKKDIAVTFATTGKFFNGNVFTFELSDANGDFKKPTVLGTKTAVASGSFTATLPASVGIGTAYKIRVSSTKPAVSGILAKTFTINSVAKPTISVNGNLLTSSASTGNKWFLNSQEISGATSRTFTATESGLYKVKASDVNDCSSESDEINVSVTTTGIEVISLNQNVFDIKAYPNPFYNEIAVSYNLIGTDETTIELLDLEGKVVSRPVQNQIQTAGQHEIIISAKNLGLSPGVYFLKVSSGSHSTLMKLNHISE